LIAGKIPNGKLLLFPNYPFLDLCWEKWRKILPIAQCFSERNGENQLEQYQQACKKNSAYLFAVCRGKYSEGFDSKDE